jgi:hypothetical protein
VFTNGSSLENVTLEDFDSTDVLVPLLITNDSYALLVEEGFNFSSLNASIYTTGKTIGNGLNNDYDLILLRDATNTIVDAVIYDNSYGAHGTNESLCRMTVGFSACTPTPGAPNNLSSNSLPNTTQQPPATMNYSLVITEFLSNPIGDDRAALPGGEWVEIYNIGKTAADVEGLQLADARNTTVTVSDVHFVGSSVVAPQNYLVLYLNGKTLLNNDGADAISLLAGGKTLDRVSYDGSREGVSWSRQADGSFIFSIPSPGKENPADNDSLHTTIILEKIDVGNDGRARFGDYVRLRLKITKGDTTKNMIKIYVQNVTRQHHINLYEKFLTTTFTFPLFLEPDCTNRTKDGVYTLVVDGLDARLEANISLAGRNTQYCKATKSSSVAAGKKTNTIATKSTKHDTSSVSATDSADTFINKPGVLIYESNDAKVQRYALYFFCIVLILIVSIYAFHLE